MGSSASKAARSAGKSFPSSTKQAAARLGLGEGHAQQQQQRVASLREEQPPPMFHGEKDEGEHRKHGRLVLNADQQR